MQRAGIWWWRRGNHKKPGFSVTNEAGIPIRKVPLKSGQYYHVFIRGATKAVKKQNKRVGPLFQGPFHAKLVEENGHLLQLSRYIHLNPVRAKLVKKPEEWIYSSYQDYLGLRRGTLPKPGVVLENFSSIEDYRKFVEEAMDQYEEIQYLLEDG